MTKPVSAKRGHKIFYGWYIVAGATVAGITSTAINVYAPPILLKPMTAEFGWSRTDFFMVQALASIVGALAAPFVGRQIDRGNPRLLVLAGSLTLAASVMAYSQVHSLWLYLLLAGIVTPAGQSLCGAAVFNTIVGKWFVRKRGRALSTTTAGVNVGGIIMPPAVVALIAWSGWRMAWIVLGVVILVIVIPVALLVKRSPEDMGLRPDGEPQPRATGPVSPPRQEPEWGWRQLRRTRSFWMLAVTFGLGGMAVGGVSFHIYPFLTDRDIPPTVAASTLSVMSIAGLAFRPLWSYIFEHWELRYVSLLTFLAIMLNVLGLLLTTNVPVLFLAMAVRGFSSGGYLPLGTMVWGHHFGRRSLGQVLGLSHLIGLPFSAAGPVLAAWMFDRLHNYVAVFSIYATILLLCAVALFLIRPPGTRMATAPGHQAIRPR